MLYALANPGGDAGDDLAAAEGLAAAMGLAVRDRQCDDTGDTTPRVRPGWARVIRTLGADQSVRGVIAVSRVALSTDDRLYEAELNQLALMGKALWLVRAETAL